MKLVIIIAVLAGLVTGCTSKSKARAQAQNAYLAGQNAALQSTLQTTGVTVIGPVQNTHVPFVAGLTLAQALATAYYTGPGTPSQIILTRKGEDATLDPNDLDRAAQFMLEPGDLITLKP